MATKAVKSATNHYPNIKHENEMLLRIQRELTSLEYNKPKQFTLHNGLKSYDVNISQDHLSFEVSAGWPFSSARTAINEALSEKWPQFFTAGGTRANIKTMVDANLHQYRRTNQMV